MGNSKISKDFSTTKFTDSGLSTKSSYIADKLTDNAAFTAPKPTIADFKAAIVLYNLALGKVEYGTKEDTVNKNNLRAALVALLKELADYVQTTSGGDEALILSTGFDVNKKPSTVGELDKPENLTAKPGSNKGTIMLTCDVVDYANFYEFEYRELTPAGNGIWIQKTSTKRKLQIDGLISGKQYEFRVAGAGSYPTRVWSEIVTSFVL
jgi:hypothetical protein